MGKLDEWRRNILIATLSETRSEIDRKREG